MTPTRRAVILGGSSLITAGLSRSTFAAAGGGVRADTTGSDTAKPTPFDIDVAEAVLSRIHTRVKAVHWPTISEGAAWKYGCDAGWLRDLVGYWRDGFDWRTAEAALNRTPQFTASVDGRPIHFAHLKPAGEKGGRTPFLLLHGWPYTFATMLPLAETLAAKGFEVVVPSTPGTGFSPAPDDQVRGLRFISRRIGRLMTQVLGHERYLIHGGDHGAVIADWLAIDTPQHVAGIHANMIAFRHAGASFGSGQTGLSDAAPEETAFVKTEVATQDREGAYFRLQQTRPETVAYALTDSPVGWAAYMLDKWQKWTDTRERAFKDIYSRDRLLTEVMIFLVTDTVATSLWPYAGFALEPFGLEPGQTIDVPFGHSSYPDPLLPRTPRRFAERSRTNIKLWREHEKGGHFPMLEHTAELAGDIVAFAGMT